MFRIGQATAVFVDATIVRVAVRKPGESKGSEETRNRSSLDSARSGPRGAPL
jgi:hypothetical protein